MKKTDFQTSHHDIMFCLKRDNVLFYISDHIQYTYFNCHISFLAQVIERKLFFFFFLFFVKVILILVTLNVIPNLLSMQASFTPILIVICHLWLNLLSKICFSIFSNSHLDHDISDSIHDPELGLYGS